MNLCMSECLQSPEEGTRCLAGGGMGSYELPGMGTANLTWLLCEKKTRF